MNIASMAGHFDEKSLDTRLYTQNTRQNIKLVEWLLYISNSFAFKPRPDLSNLMYQLKTFKSVFAEIIVLKKINIIMGIIYNHLKICLLTLSILNF